LKPKGAAAATELRYLRRTLITLIALLALGAAPAAGKLPNAPNDAYWGKQWGLRQIEATKAWSHSTGAGQRIAIVDTGIDLDHPDLRDQIVGGATFDCPTGPRPCGHGGWRSGEKGSPSGHGTHVAGIAAATTNNGKGIAGVAPDAKLLAVKVGDNSGVDPGYVASGIRWAVRHGADVINLSLGSFPGSQALTGAFPGFRRERAAIAYARSKGVVVVASAGNDSASICDTPSFHRGALCVTATDRFRRKAPYSNFGVKPRLGAVGAPGGAGIASSCEERVISAFPPNPPGEAIPRPCSDDLGPPNYDFRSGTSAAAPHVAGVAALLTAQGRSAGETKRVIKATARTPRLGTGFYTPTHGWGIVDAEAAVAAP
jgi:serine protease